MPKKKAPEAEEKAGKKPKSAKKLILMVLLALLVLGGAAAGAYYFFGRPASQEAGAAKKVASSKETQAFDLGEVIVNLSGNSHYLRLKAVLEYPKVKKLPEELKKKEHIIKDALITTLRSKSYADVNSPQGMENLKKEILQAINNNLESGQATGVYFTDYLVQ